MDGPKPSDPADAERITRATLKKDADHHFKWLLVDLALLLVSAPLVVIPGPNIPGFYFTFQVVGHYLSMRGAKQGLSVAQWTFKPSEDLSELREALRLPSPHRQRRCREVADRLRLEHLARFCDHLATPTA